jgi:hypothetical protein
VRAAIILNCARLSSIFSRAERAQRPWPRLNSQSVTDNFVINHTCGYALDSFVGSRVARYFCDD